MEIYRNLSDTSGVHSYEIGSEHIKVQFSGAARIYTYSYRKAGRDHVEQMKQLARNGRGLQTYINKFVKYSYD